MTPGRKRLRKRLLRQTGRSTDGRPVLGGVFKLMESQGIPLQFILHDFAQRGFLVDWPDLLNDALAMRWNLSTVFARIEEAVSDVHGKPHADAILQRLRRHVHHRDGSSSFPVVAG